MCCKSKFSFFVCRAAFEELQGMPEGTAVPGTEGGLLEAWHGRMVAGDIFVLKEM